MTQRDEIDRVLDSTHTVHQLILALAEKATGRYNSENMQRLQKTLSQFGATLDVPVLFTSNYGDRGRTEQALPIAEVTQAGTRNLYDTPYSDSGIAYDEERDEERDELQEVIILER